MENAKIQIYTGNGKGKTTAALGLSLRASGAGLKTWIGQFMKGSDYSELHVLEHFPHVEIEQLGWPNCIRKEKVTEEHCAITRRGLEITHEKASSGAYDVVILDEILVSLYFSLIDEESVIAFLDEFRGKVEIVMTGRYASEAMMAQADLVTEMKCLKHYYDEGVMARKGIEC